ncbi:inorganic diphosphatase [Candidatus Woesearchaeota archaeon]|nr:inorganic diphosphatase [Candidatus Woesearchaeota archaeon]
MDMLHDIKPGEVNKLNVIIEVPKGSRIKYELDKETGLIKVDRVLYSPMHYPANYGFVPQTLWEDGDPLDVLVIGYEELIPGCLIEARPVAMLEMNDGGDDDVKILAVPTEDPRFKDIETLNDVHPHLLAEIKHFFMVYKHLENKKVDVGEWCDEKAAEAAIKKSFELYKGKRA